MFLSYETGIFPLSVSLFLAVCFWLVVFVLFACMHTCIEMDGK